MTHAMTNQAAEAPALSEPSSDARTLGMVAWLLAIFTGFLGPLILFLIKKEEDGFVRFHAGQALFLNLLAIPLAVVTLGLFAILLLVVDIIWLIKAYKGEWALLPVVGKWAWPKSMGPPPA